jgi:uncharacterized protein (PEP-CTERM system associated)
MAVTANKLRPCGTRTELHSPFSLAGTFSVFMAMAFAMPAHAVNWRFEPNVGASATYTDNANQDESNPKGALILAVRPGFTLTSEGSRRVQASVRYGLSGVARFGEDESTDLNHNLGATGKAELVEDFLFIDGSARVSQELISLFGSPADADINDSNRTTVGTYSVSPYIQKRFGTFANAQARYTNSGAIFENDVASNTSVNAFEGGLTSGTRFNDLSWGLNYSIRKADNRDEANTTIERASATVGYALTRKFRVFGTVGQDWNDYYSTAEIDGSFYSVGFGWSPTRRTSLEASVGERYYGNTYSLSAMHRTRSSRWMARYSEDISDISQQLLDQSSQLYFACATVPYFPPAADLAEAPPPDCEGPYPASVAASVLQDVYGLSVEELVALGFPAQQGIYIIKSFNAGVSWDVGRLGFGLSVRDTRRLYQVLDNAEDHVQGVTGSVSYRMSPHTIASGSLSLTRNSEDASLSPGGIAREDNILGLSLGLNHQFTSNLNGALVFRHTQRDSNAAGDDYQENRITASVNMRF